MNIKDIKEFPGYCVSDDGKVFSGDKELKQFKNPDGYMVVNLCKNNKSFHRRVNRLVAQTFIPNPDNLPIVNHIDHVRDNNHITNLEWCTHLHNNRESYRLFPERKRNHTTNREQAIKICELAENGLRNKEISEIVGVSPYVVNQIRSGITWKEVSENYRLKRSVRGISEETCRWVCRMILLGLSNKEILKRSTSNRLTKDVIKNIRSKRCWEHVSKEYF